MWNTSSYFFLNFESLGELIKLWKEFFFLKLIMKIVKSHLENKFRITLSVRKFYNFACGLHNFWFVLTSCGKCMRLVAQITTWSSLSCQFLRNLKIQGILPENCCRWHSVCEARLINCETWSPIGQITSADKCKRVTWLGVGFWLDHWHV